MTATPNVCAACSAGRHDQCGAQVSASGTVCFCETCWGKKSGEATDLIARAIAAGVVVRTPAGKYRPVAPENCHTDVDDQVYRFWKKVWENWSERSG
jgi:hypothetical protein